MAIPEQAAVRHLLWLRDRLSEDLLDVAVITAGIAVIPAESRVRKWALNWPFDSCTSKVRLASRTSFRIALVTFVVLAVDLIRERAAPCLPFNANLTSRLAFYLRVIDRHEIFEEEGCCVENNGPCPPFHCVDLGHFNSYVGPCGWVRLPPSS
jgi:hypothetical protein